MSSPDAPAKRHCLASSKMCLLSFVASYYFLCVLPKTPSFLLFHRPQQIESPLNQTLFFLLPPNFSFQWCFQSPLNQQPKGLQEYGLLNYHFHHRPCCMEGLEREERSLFWISKRRSFESLRAPSVVNFILGE